jgi:hypothetical protein
MSRLTISIAAAPGDTLIQIRIVVPYLVLATAS